MRNRIQLVPVTAGILVEIDARITGFINEPSVEAGRVRESGERFFLGPLLSFEGSREQNRARTRGYER